MNNLTHENLHRTAKYFMDSGRAKSADEALAMLKRYGLYVVIGPEVAVSRDHQIALFSLVNIARRTFLGGVHVIGTPEVSVLSPLITTQYIKDGITELGGRIVNQISNPWPVAVIGSGDAKAITGESWRVTWEGWRGGVVPLRDGRRLSESWSIGITPALAAAVCAAEIFMFYAGDHPMSGHRDAGLSLWNPGRNWLKHDKTEVELRFLPSRLWLIGLGNLGQAYLWMLASLPYRNPAELELMLQDYDRLTDSNESTSVLTFQSIVGGMKTRRIAEWLEARGFRAAIEERLFGSWSRRAPHEPAVALCGVDNAFARASLENAGFGLIVEAGLGDGPFAFKNFSLHTFPSSLSAVKLWGNASAPVALKISDMPAYEPLNYPHLDECGLAQLASRTVGVPFVSVTAAALVIAEILRRLNGGRAFSVLSGSLSALDDIEGSRVRYKVYEFGHIPAAAPRENLEKDLTRVCV